MGSWRQWWQIQRPSTAPRHQGSPHISCGILNCLDGKVYQQHVVVRTMATLVADSAAFCASAEAAGSMERMSLSRGKAICTGSNTVYSHQLKTG